MTLRRSTNPVRAWPGSRCGRAWVGVLDFETRMPSALGGIQ